jgi:predicted NBD/HSP70 family sugar kinase
MTNFFTGIELTKKHINFFIADGSYRIKNTHRAALPPQFPAAKLIDEIENGFYEAMKKSSLSPDRVAAISISVPATLNHKHGNIIHSTAMPQLKNLNIKEELGARLKKFIVLDTEANVRTFIEHKIGSAARYNNFIFILLDSWISAGIYINNSLLRSKNAAAHELGHIIVEPHGRKCECSQRGCLEEYASDDAVIRYYLKHKRNASRNNVTIHDLFRLAGASDFAATNAFYKMGNYLGLALINIVNIVKPDAVIFAGDFSKGLNFFLPAMKSTLDIRSYYGPANGIAYQKSGLDQNAVKLGLVHLAKDSYTNAYNLKVCDDIFII